MVIVYCHGEPCEVAHRHGEWVCACGQTLSVVGEVIPCEAWCWTHSDNRPVRPCSRPGRYSAYHGCSLCYQHEAKVDPCLSESAARQRRRDTQRVYKHGWRGKVAA